MADISSQLPVRDIADGSVAPGTAATESILVGAVHNTTAPTLTNGQQAALQTDANGNLLVNSIGTSTVTGTVSTNLNGLTTFQTSQYTVGISAVQLTPTPLVGRSSMSIKVKSTTGTDMVYIGNSSSVTASTGYALFNGDSIQMDLTPAQVIWAIGTSAGQIVYVMEIGD